MGKGHLILFLSFLSNIASEFSYASGFGLKLNSAILAGQANAGSAVIDDPLAIFTNPASTIQQNNTGFALQGTGVFPNVRFKGTTTDPLVPGFLHTIRSRQAAKNAFVPSAAIATRLHERFAVGLVLNTPFGLKFDFGHNWGGNRYGITSSLETVNATPTLAVKLQDKFSIGGGVQIQRSNVIASTQTSSSNPLAQFLLQEDGTRSRAKIHGWGVGWTAGILFQPICALKIGFSYRSEINTHLKGYLNFHNVPNLLALNPALQNSSIKSKIKYPRIFTLSASYDITSNWTTLFDIIRSNWSSIKQIVFSTPINSQSQLIQQKWKDTWFFSGGVNYQVDPSWLLRPGLGYDQAASRTQFRVPNIPDSSSIWTTIGFTYSWDKKLSTSLSYGHVFYKNPKINLLESNSGNRGKGNLKGYIREHADLISVQVNYQF